MTRRLVAIVLVAVLACGPALAIGAPSSALAAGSSGSSSSAAGTGSLGSGSSGFGLGSSSNTDTTSSVATTDSTTTSSSSSGSGGFTGGDAILLGAVAMVLLAGICFYVWWDARRSAPDHSSVGHGLPGATRGGSKPPPKSRKLSPAERKRRKRGRA